MDLRSYLKKPDYLPWIWTIVLFFCTRLVLTVAGVLARSHFGVEHNFIYSKFSWLAIWGAWDTGWYLPIAQYGYSAHLSASQATLGQANYAFFPLYPLLVRYAAKIIGNVYTAGAVLSNLCLILAAVVFYKLARLDYDQKFSLAALVLLFCFPTAFMLSAVLSESLFLLLSLGVFYFAGKQQWWFAGLVGFAAALARPVGAFLSLALLCEYFYQPSRQWKKIKFDVLLTLLPLAGLLSYFWYLKKLTGNFFAFINIQHGWGRNWSDHLKTLTSGHYHPATHTLVAIIFILAAGFLIWKSYKTLRPSYLLYSLLLMLVPLTTGLDNMPRYLLVIFPLYFLLAKFTQNSKILYWSLAIIMFILQIGLFVLWTTGRNVVV